MNDRVATALGLGFIWAMTSLGSAIVFFFRGDLRPWIRSAILAFAGGIMVSASFFAVLMPALEEAQEQDLPFPYWLPAFLGYLLGCGFILLLDWVVPCIVGKEVSEEKDGDKQLPLPSGDYMPIDGVDENRGTDAFQRKKRAWKLFLSVTLHNIPEGVACGLVFGAAHNQPAGRERENAVLKALGLALGIGIQNIPEGAAVALPVREMSDSNCKGFFFGVMSGIVEPIFGIFSLFIATALKKIDPWALGFSAGAMTYVVVEELIPESRVAGYSRLPTWAFNIGFLIMMGMELGITLGED
jgi:ZIP family zinc transporter